MLGSLSYSHVGRSMSSEALSNTLRTVMSPLDRLTATLDDDEEPSD